MIFNQLCNGVGDTLEHLLEHSSIESYITFIIFLYMCIIFINIYIYSCILNLILRYTWIFTVLLINNFLILDYIPITNFLNLNIGLIEIPTIIDSNIILKQKVLYLF